MVLTAVRGALGFLSRLPIGRGDGAWDAFRTTPAAFPVAAYGIGALVAVPLVLPLPAPVVAFGYVLAVYLVTGPGHADGLADIGDALAAHGTPGERRGAMKDTAIGVGGVLSLGIVLVGLALGAVALGPVPLRDAVGLAIAAEVAAKLGMAAVACLGTASHEGLGAAFTRSARPVDLAVPVAVALPAALLTWPSPAAAIALAGGLAGSLAVLWWATRRLGGVGGDAIGAANEIGRVVALHAGVIAWTRF